jgi:D-tyrosyl-tRNA(Tyr) deacylase
MRTIIQRVQNASVSTNNQTIGSIKSGLLVFLGVHQADSEATVISLVEKISNLRIFKDSNNKLNLSALDINAEVLVISQFTLYADCSKGNRPSFAQAAEPTKAEHLYTLFIDQLKQKNLTVASGEFGADMQVSLINDGPVTILLDT